MSAGTVLLIQMRRIVRVFRDAGATHPAAAIIPAQHGLRQSFAFQKLVRKGVLIAVNAERYYMDEEAEAKYRKQRQSIVLVIMLLLLAGLLISLFVSR